MSDGRLFHLQAVLSARNGSNRGQSVPGCGKPDTISIASVPWNRLFTDAYLQDLITIGLRQNTDLRIARTKVEAAEAVLMKAQLSYLPSLSLTPEGGISHAADQTVAKTYHLSASASWEIDLFGKLTNAKRESRAALESSRAYEQAVHTGLIATIAGSYYTLLMLDRQWDISQRTLTNWAETEKVLEALKGPVKPMTRLYFRQRQVVWPWNLPLYLF